MIIDDLSVDDIRRKLNGSNNKPKSNDEKYSGKKQSAVLVPLIKLESGWHLLFIKRTETVNHHKGQIAFPGGAYDNADGTLLVTSLRETQEEIGLSPEEVHILGRIKSFHTTSNYTISPYVAVVKWPFEILLSIDEVEKVMLYPLAWLADPNNVEEREINLDGCTKITAIFYKQYQGEILWGATARIVHNFITLLID